MKHVALWLGFLICWTGVLIILAWLGLVVYGIIIAVNGRN